MFEVVIFKFRNTVHLYIYSDHFHIFMLLQCPNSVITIYVLVLLKVHLFNRIHLIWLMATSSTCGCVGVSNFVKMWIC
jgi:hypothetical protein